MRLGPGPVFVYEWLTTARRWQLYALRALFVTAILAGLALTWAQVNRDHDFRERLSLQELAEYGRSIYFTIVVVELTLVLLAAPAATAGAICLDKARGTLDHVLTTDLSNAEIVLGKLGVRPRSAGLFPTRPGGVQRGVPKKDPGGRPPGSAVLRHSRWIALRPTRPV